MKAHISYLKGLIKHKYWVYVYCIRFSVPFRIAIFHDMSKFLPKEWFPYVKNFYNDDGSKKDIRDKSGAYDTNKQSNEFKLAWIHHQRNKHHWQAWCNIGDGGVVTCVDIPEVYTREMVADWCGAGMSYSGKATPNKWYRANKDKMILSDRSRFLVEHLLKYIWDDE